MVRMVPLHSMLTHSKHVARRLFLALVGVLLLAGCGSSARGDGPGGAATGGASGQSHEPRLFNARSSGSGGGLLIVTDGARCGSYLVLKNPAGSYDSTAIRQMAEYVRPYSEDFDEVPLPTLPGYDSLLPSSGVAQGEVFYANYLDWNDPGIGETPPDSLQWVAGGLDCFAELKITNTGSSDMQITSMGATLISDAVRNDYTYNLLNICSVQSNQQCHGRGGGTGGDRCAYYAHVVLAGGAAGAHVEAPLNNVDPLEGGECPMPLTIKPGDVATVIAKFSSPFWLYRAKLTFGMRTSAGTNRLSFSSLQQNLAFVDETTRFNCYSLRGSTFTRELPQTPSKPEILTSYQVCL